MNYQDDELGLIQLLGDLERIQNTFPPVYRAAGFLIGYDKQGRIRILATSPAEKPVPQPWLDRALQLLRGAPPQATGRGLDQ